MRTSDFSPAHLAYSLPCLTALLVANMPSDDEQMGHRIGRKFSRKRHSSSGAVTQSMLLPSRPNFSDADDHTDVCTASKNIPFNMNQSFFQMITAATSGLKMSSRFDEDSDEDDEDTEAGGVAVAGAPPVDKGKPKAVDRKPWAPTISRLHSIEESGDVAGDASGDDSDLDTENKLGPAPFMSQMLEAQAQMNPAEFGAATLRTEAEMFGQAYEETGEKSSELSKRLMEIFDLPQMESVVSGNPPKALL